MTKLTIIMVALAMFGSTALACNSLDKFTHTLAETNRLAAIGVSRTDAIDYLSATVPARALRRMK